MRKRDEDPYFSSSVRLYRGNDLPEQWELICQNDQEEYLRMRMRFRDAGRKSRKGERLEEFRERLTTIRNYVNSKESEKWKRSIVCGVFFVNHGLAINIQQLMILMGKCKSSINGSLQQLGYATQPTGTRIESYLLETIPFFHENMHQIKKWTIRQKIVHDLPFSHPPPQRRVGFPISVLPWIPTDQRMTPNPQSNVLVISADGEDKNLRYECSFQHS